eukprot:5916043-Alexandrium_andersonii.AAC.1
MSASLVGSEMCIRDSVTTVYHETLSGGFRREQSWQQLMSHVPWSEVCLLYTSDAADDMSV